MKGYVWSLKYSPDQPRVPAGSSEGGRWTDGDVGWPSVPDESELREWWYGSYTDMDRGALDYYQGSGFINVNASLRGLPGGGTFEADELTQDMIRQIDAAVAQNELSHDSVLWRGFAPRQLGVDDVRDLVGKTVQDEGFVSTSLEERIAQSFAFSHDGVVARIVARKGTNAAYIPSEKEVLLPRGKRFRIVAVERTDVGGGEWLDYVTLEVAP